MDTLISHALESSARLISRLLQRNWALVVDARGLVAADPAACRLPPEKRDGTTARRLESWPTFSNVLRRL
jgi:hypothetical protein